MKILRQLFFMLQYKKNAAGISEMLETAACFTRAHRKSACSAVQIFSFIGN